jgi:hypothetical protein
LGPIVVSVVVVGACIAVVSRWLARSGTVEDATSRAGSGRAAVDAHTPWWVRLRSAVALGCLSVVMGVAFAVAIGVSLVVLFALLRSSVG